MKERQGGWRPSVFTLLVTAWLIGFGYTFYTQQTHLDEVADDRAEAVAKLEAERVRNEALKAERDGLSKPEYVEKVAREELGMTRNGEMPYIAAKK